MRQRILARSFPGNPRQVPASTVARLGDGAVDCGGTTVAEFGDLLLGGRIDDGDHLTGPRPAADLVQNAATVIG